MTDSAFVLHIIKTYHRGQANAITREALLETCRLYGLNLSDRELRAIYAELPVCTCDKGVFWPETLAELEEYRRYLRAKAFPMLERWQRVARAHSDLIDSRQGELF